MYPVVATKEMICSSGSVPESIFAGDQHHIVLQVMLQVPLVQILSIMFPKHLNAEGQVE